MNTDMKLQKVPVEKLKPAKYNPRKDLKPGDPAGSVNLYAQKSKQAAKEKSRYAMEESPRATSRCFMFMYFLLPH